MNQEDRPDKKARALPARTLIVLVATVIGAGMVAVLVLHMMKPDVRAEDPQMAQFTRSP